MSLLLHDSLYKETTVFCSGCNYISLLSPFLPLALPDANQGKIVHSGGLRVLVPLLCSSDIETTTAAVAALRNLSIHKGNEASEYYMYKQLQFLFFEHCLLCIILSCTFVYTVYVQTCTVQLCNRVFILPCTHTAMRPYCHASILPCTHTAMRQYCHAPILPCINTAMRPYCRVSILPCVHTAMRPYCRASILPCVHTAVCPYCHASILPCVHTPIPPYM